MLSPAVIERNKREGPVPSRYWELHAGRARLNVRRRGAVVTRLALPNASGNLVRPLYAASPTTAPKLRASHMVAPFGPHDGHGRYVDWTVAERREYSRFSTLSLDAPAVEHALGLRRNFILTPASLSIESTVLADYAEDDTAFPNGADTSVGEHLYLPLAGGDAFDVTIDSWSLPDILGSKRMAALTEGEAQVLNDWAGSSVVGLPNMAVRLSAGVKMPPGQATAPRSLVVWMEKPANGEVEAEAPFLCIEPVLGVRQSPEGLQANLLHLAAGEFAVHTTTIAVIR